MIGTCHPLIPDIDTYAPNFGGSIDSNYMQTSSVTNKVTTISPIYAIKSLESGSGNGIFVGSFTVPAGTTPQFLKINTPISVFVKLWGPTKKFYGRVDFNIQSVRFTIATSLYLSIPTVSATSSDVTSFENTPNTATNRVVLN